MKAALVVAAVLALASASLGCKKKENAAAGSATATATGAGTATATATGAGTATASASGAGTATGTGSAEPAPPPAQTPAAAFAAAFDPVNSKLDHVSRARTACEQRATWLDIIKAMDASAAGVGALHKAVDEMGDPCDEGNIKAIEAKLDEAKQALDALPK